MSLSVLILCGLFAVFIQSHLYALIRNFLAARRRAVPYLVFPFNHNSLLYILFSVPMRPYLKHVLPTWFWKRLTLTIYGWEFHEKREPFDRRQHQTTSVNNVKPSYSIGKTFAIVSTGTLEIWTADPALATEVLKRVDVFEMPSITGKLLGVFGPNVLTTNGERWRKQRKVVAAVINERISERIWDATLKQTTGMLEELTELCSGPLKSHGGTETRIPEGSNGVFDMLKRITMHVLAEAGMGATVPWSSADEELPPPGFSTTYMQACKTVMASVTGANIVPTRLLIAYPRWLPGATHLRRLGVEKKEFVAHTKVLLQAERDRITGLADEEDTDIRPSNIMAHLLRASAEGRSGDGLSEEELSGNLFLFTAAGFETTANTLSYALMMLLRHPEWQDWLYEELDTVLPVPSKSAGSYIATFPHLPRMMALMFETLRLYTPVVKVVRTNPLPQKVNTSNGMLHIPANTTITVNHIGLHLDPSVWRNSNHSADPVFRTTTPSHCLNDESIFRPSRWILPASQDNTDAVKEGLWQPPRGSFVPWGFGPRVCPGQKMGQVEFVGAMATLLARHRVAAVPLEGESQVDLEKRLDGILSRSVSRMTLIMEDVYDVKGKENGVGVRLCRRQ